MPVAVTQAQQPTIPTAFTIIMLAWNSPICPLAWWESLPKIRLPPRLAQAVVQVAAVVVQVAVVQVVGGVIRPK